MEVLTAIYRRWAIDTPVGPSEVYGQGQEG